MKTYRFRIAESYTPRTLPMVRLAEYIAEYGRLLGEVDQVHFDKVTEGSVQLATMKRFDVQGAQHNALDVAALLVCANRACSGPGVDSDGIYGVGCFLQMTFLQQHQTRQWIAHRWPDPIGEPIDPSRGQPVPDLPLSLP